MDISKEKTRQIVFSKNNWQVFVNKKEVLFVDVAGYLGISSGFAKDIVNAIKKYGYAFIGLSAIAFFMSGATLSGLLAGADYICATVLSFVQRHLSAAAVVW